jgi:phage terminase large subunit GpA-like protein
MDIVNNNEDVRLDWELLAHTSNGQTYSINHGSIGTFKRSKWRNTKDKEKDSDRERFTFIDGVSNSVWPIFKKMIYDSLEGESGLFYDIDITVIDTGHFTKLANNFISGIKDRKVFGVKGRADESYMKIDKNAALIQHSKTDKGTNYIVEVELIKDKLASDMSLVCGTDGTQPNGFMNFPQPSDGKYNLKTYFSHFESEHRVPLIKNDVEVGFKWKKKREDNHFWDCRVYNMAAREIFIADLKLYESANRDLTWQNYCELINM